MVLDGQAASLLESFGDEAAGELLLDFLHTSESFSVHPSSWGGSSAFSPSMSHANEIGCVFIRACASLGSVGSGRRDFLGAIR